MDHRLAQAEFRRLKAERAARIAQEQFARAAGQQALASMRRYTLSHDDVAETVARCHESVPDDLEILSLEPTEGGWIVTARTREA